MASRSEFPTPNHSVRHLNARSPPPNSGHSSDAHLSYHLEGDKRHGGEQNRPTSSDGNGHGGGGKEGRRDGNGQQDSHGQADAAWTASWRSSVGGRKSVVHIRHRTLYLECISCGYLPISNRHTQYQASSPTREAGYNDRAICTLWLWSHVVGSGRLSQVIVRLSQVIVQVGVNLGDRSAISHTEGDTIDGFRTWEACKDTMQRLQGLQGMVHARSALCRRL